MGQMWSTLAREEKRREFRESAQLCWAKASSANAYAMGGPTHDCCKSDKHIDVIARRAIQGRTCSIHFFPTTSGACVSTPLGVAIGGAPVPLGVTVLASDFPAGLSALLVSGGGLIPCGEAFTTAGAATGGAQSRIRSSVVRSSHK